MDPEEVCRLKLLTVSPDLVESQPSCTEFEMKGGCISKPNLRIHHSTCVSNDLKCSLGFLRETWRLPLPPSENCTSLTILLTYWLQCFVSYWLETSSQISKSVRQDLVAYWQISLWLTPGDICTLPIRLSPFFKPLTLQCLVLILFYSPNSLPLDCRKPVSVPVCYRMMLLTGWL